MNDGIAVRLVDGRFVVVLTAAALPELAALVEQAHALRVRSGRLPLPSATDFTRACRHAHALTQVVPTAEPDRDSQPPQAPAWLTTAQAARHLRISERAVRKRIKAGRLPAQTLGGRWVIDPKELHRAAS